VVVRQLVITITIIIVIFIIIGVVIIIVIIALIVSWSSSISTSPPSFNIDRIVIIITLVTIIDIAAASMFIAGTGGASALVIAWHSYVIVVLSASRLSASSTLRSDDCHANCGANKRLTTRVVHPRPKSLERRWTFSVIDSTDGSWPAVRPRTQGCSSP